MLMDLLIEVGRRIVVWLAGRLTMVLLRRFQIEEPV